MNIAVTRKKRENEKKKRRKIIFFSISFSMVSDKSNIIISKTLLSQSMEGLNLQNVIELVEESKEAILNSSMICFTDDLAV